MLISIDELFANKQNLTATALSENVIDLGATGVPIGSPRDIKRDIGRGTPIEFACQVDALNAGDGGDSTLQVELLTSDSEDMSGAVVTATSAMLKVIDKKPRAAIRIVTDFIDKRYFALNFVVGGTTPDMVVTAGICAGVQTNRKDS